MNKKLEKMKLKELWQLFPIFLVEHNKEWIKWYEEERENMDPYGVIMYHNSPSFKYL